MKRHLIADMHADTLMRMLDLGYKLDDDRLQVSLPKMLNGGHDIQIFPCFIDPAVGKDRYVQRTLQMIDLLKSEVDQHKAHISFCVSLAQIKRTLSQGKKVALLSIEGGHAIANDLSVLRCYRKLGVIYMTLTWSNTNDWADSSNDQERWGGLTQFGQSVVREMNRIGMMVDISHVSDKTFWHVLRITKKPVVASHSSVRALCNHPRNMSDEMIKAMAEQGGVVFVNFYASFISQKFYDAHEDLRRRYHKRLKEAALKWQHKPEMITYEEERVLQPMRDSLPRVKLDEITRHIAYIAKIAGVDAVGLGSDFDGIPFWPDDLPDCSAFPALLARLKKRGFKPSEIEKIASGNFLRVFGETVG